MEERFQQNWVSFRERKNTETMKEKPGQRKEKGKRGEARRERDRKQRRS